MSDNKDLETLYPEGKPITIKGEEFKIKPFVLRNRIKVVAMIADVFVEMAKNNPGLGAAGTNATLIAFINTAGEKVVDLYALVLGKDKEWLMDNVSLKEEILILSAILEVNDFPFLVSQAKAMMNK